MPESVKWLPWGGDVFNRALPENKPIILYLTASWCRWGEIMGRTTFRILRF